MSELRNDMKKLFYLIIIFFMLCTPVFSTEYFVCNSDTTCNAGAGSGWSTGNDGNNGTAKSTPWLTVQHCIDTISAGDTCTVGDGTYTDETGSSPYWLFQFAGKDGGSGTEITIQAENQYGAVLSGTDATSHYGIGIYNSDYIIIDGFEITGSRDDGVYISGDSANVTIINCKIHNIGRFTPTTSGESFEGYSGVYSGPSTRYITIDRNLIYDIGRLHGGAYSGEDYSHDHGMYARGAYIYFTNNILWDIDSGFQFMIREHYTPEVIETTHVISNNTFINTLTDVTSTGVVRIYGTGADGETTFYAYNVLIQNNIDLDSQGRDFLRWNLDRVGGTDSQVLNNVGSWNDVADLHTYIDVEANNKKLTYPVLKAQLLNPDTYDFHLVATASDLIDTGASASAPDHDFDNVSRPQGAADDIGAYEYNLYIYNASPTGTGIGLDADLNWTNPTGTVTVDVYFEEVSGACDLQIGDRISTGTLIATKEQGAMTVDTAYCWRVDVVHAGGTETGTVYEFTTPGGPPPPPAGLSAISYHSLGMTGVYDD